MATGMKAFKEKNANDMSVAEYRQRSREATRDSDMQAARDRGETYNQMYKRTAASDKAKGILNSSAAAKGLAYELSPPSEVRAQVDNRGAGAGRGVTKYASGGLVMTPKSTPYKCGGKV